MKSNLKLLLSPLFIVFAIYLICFKNFQYFAIYFFVVLLHELAHFFVSRRLGYKLNKFYIMPYGVCLNYKENVFAASDEMTIALAGPLFNYLICFIVVALWWLFPETYYYLDYFCFCNFTLATFNILPCFPLDGGRVIISLFSKKFDREKVYRVSLFLNYAISFIMVVLFIISAFNDINYTYIFIAIFLFSGTISPNKFSSYNYLSLGVNRRNIIKNGASVKIFATSGTTPIYKIMAKFSKYKYNVVYVVISSGAVHVLSEGNINALAIKYSPTLSLDEILLLKK